MTWGLTGQTKGSAWVVAWWLTARICFGAGIENPETGAFPQLEEIRGAAASGEPTAQFKMGDHFYARGNFTDAVSWYQLAAENGHRGAQISLATCYLQGRGVPKDLQLASKWSARARGELAQLTPPTIVPPPNEEAPEQPAKSAEKEPEPAHPARHAVKGLERIPPELDSVQLRLESYLEEWVR